MTSTELASIDARGSTWPQGMIQRFLAVVIALMCLGGASVVSASAANAGLRGDTLSENAQLFPGDYLWSQNYKYELNFQTDGNLVLKNRFTARICWHAGTHGRGGARLIMQGDSNLVMYARYNAVVWHTNTYDNRFDTTQPRLVLQDDGNLVLYHSVYGYANGVRTQVPQAIWYTNTVGC